MCVTNAAGAVNALVVKKNLHLVPTKLVFRHIKSKVGQYATCFWSAESVQKHGLQLEEREMNRKDKISISAAATCLIFFCSCLS